MVYTLGYTNVFQENLSGKKISLATIHGDLAILQSGDNIKFNPYPKGYEFDDRNQAITTKCKVTGGAWNEAEVTTAVPRFKYDGEQIKLVGAVEISGLSHHGNGGSSFKETERKLMTTEDFEKLCTEAEQRRVAMAAGKQKQ